MKLLKIPTKKISQKLKKSNATNNLYWHGKHYITRNIALKIEWKLRCNITLNMGKIICAENTQ